MKEIEDIHRPFIAWLTERQIPYIYHRGDRKSGIHSGHPDFTILWMRRQIMIECKTASGKLSDLQVKRIDFLRRNGNVVEIARTLSECVEAVKSILCEGKKASDPGGACNWPLEGCFRELKAAVSKVGETELVPFDGKPYADMKHEFAGGQLFVGRIGEHAYVFEGSGISGTSARLVRTATQADLINLPSSGY